MKLKSFEGLFAILLVVSISLLLVSVVGAKPVGKNPGSSWPPGTFWGTNLRLENTYAGQAWFGTRDNQLKLVAPPDPPDGLFVEFFDGSKWNMWLKVPAANENWPVRMRSVGAAPSSGTLSSVMENSDTLFVPQDFSVVLENTALGLNVNLRNENKLITGLPVLATLYLDNAVNVTISPGSQTGNPGNTVGFTVTVNNTGRYDDTYSLVVDAGNLPLYTISPSSLPINAGSSAYATLTVTLGGDSQVITVIANGDYADSNASCTVTTTTEQQYILTTSVDTLNSGSVTLDPAGGTYTSGTVVTATANPASGYEFDHWSGDASGTATSVTVTMNSDENIIAHFRSTSGGASGGLPWTWIVVGIIIIVVIIIVAVVATTGRRRVHILAR